MDLVRTAQRVDGGRSVTITEAMQMLLAEGDQEYLGGLTADALLEALENELRFLGLYRYDDTAAQALVQAYLARHLAHWMESLQGRVNCEHESPSVPVFSAKRR
jgi:hypothetical protein